MSKMTYTYKNYYVSSLTVTGFKNSRNFVSIGRTGEANFIGSIIGWQEQEHMGIVDRI